MDSPTRSVQHGYRFTRGKSLSGVPKVLPCPRSFRIIRADSVRRFQAAAGEMPADRGNAGRQGLSLNSVAGPIMAKTLRGQVLVSAKHLQDANFKKTVVLIVEHGSDGAMGVVINRPSSILVTHALAGHFHLPESTDLVYCGGPVEPAGLIILHDVPDIEERQLEVVDGLYLGCSMKRLKKWSTGLRMTIRWSVSGSFPAAPAGLPINWKGSWIEATGLRLQRLRS